MKRLMIAAAAALALSACATTAPINAPVPIAQSQVLDERALIAAESAYNVAGEAYLTAYRRNLLPADLQPRIRELLVDSFDAILLAREAYRLGNAATFTDQVAIASRLAGEAQRLIPN